MGWISKRHMERGGSIGPGGLSDRKKGAPLRRVVKTIVASDTIFAPDKVELECGHQAESWGGVRARCITCKHFCSCPASDEPVMGMAVAHLPGCPRGRSARVRTKRRKRRTVR